MQALLKQSPGQSFPAILNTSFLKPAEIQSLQKLINSFLRAFKIMILQELPDILPRPGNLGEYFIILNNKLHLNIVLYFLYIPVYFSFLHTALPYIPKNGQISQSYVRATYSKDSGK